ncbi:MAG: diphthine--ammonia ligase [Candidatus Bathyarchaeia archaeon]
MKLGALFSGGKDSCLAIYRAQVSHKVVCLINLVPRSVESRLFHFPNAWVTKFQAEAIEIPIIQLETGDEEERGLADLSRLLKSAVKDFGIEGIVTGVVRSVYQASRIQRICDELGLRCLNPLWLKSPEDILSKVLREGFVAMITGVFAYPLSERFLGKIITVDLAKELLDLGKKYGFDAAGEGGEIETTVLDGPIFKKRIEVTDYEISYKHYSGVLLIKGLKLSPKALHF